MAKSAEEAGIEEPVSLVKQILAQQLEEQVRAWEGSLDRGMEAQRSTVRSPRTHSCLMPWHCSCCSGVPSGLVPDVSMGLAEALGEGTWSDWGRGGSGALGRASVWIPALRKEFFFLVWWSNLAGLIPIVSIIEEQCGWLGSLIPRDTPAKEFEKC